MDKLLFQYIIISIVLIVLLYTLINYVGSDKEGYNKIVPIDNGSNANYVKSDKKVIYL
jgi:hypothetical protein